MGKIILCRVPVGVIEALFLESEEAIAELLTSMLLSCLGCAYPVSAMLLVVAVCQPRAPGVIGDSLVKGLWAG